MAQLIHSEPLSQALSQESLKWSFAYSVSIVHCQLMPGPELGPDSVKRRKT